MENNSPSQVARLHDDPKIAPVRTSEHIAIALVDPGYCSFETWCFEKSGPSVLEVQWSLPGSLGMHQIPILP